MKSENQLADAAEQRLEEYKKTVQNDPNRLHFHLMPPVGLLNDPNGLVFYKGQYHVFFQWNPFETAHGKKFWGHYVSDNLVEWKLLPIALSPDSWFDKNGCYSGSAIVHDDKLLLFYTGNVRDEQGNRESYQCMAVSEDGINFTKKGPVIEVPEGFTAHFRDPKVFKQGDSWYMVIGAQTSEEKGQVVLYSSDDLESWTFRGPIAGSGLNGLEDFGYMWECPDLFELNGKDILIVSPQGLEPKGYLYQNIYQSGYFAGEFDINLPNFNHASFTELDRGFDFYAPQTFEAEGRRLMYGWMGNAEEGDNIQPTVKYEWIHALTLPRELKWKNNKLYQSPAKELELLREKKVKHQGIELSNQAVQLQNVDGSVYELEVDVLDWNARSFSVSIGEKATIIYNHDQCTFTLEREGLGGATERRSCYLRQQLQTVRLYKDTSSVEIFVNNGEEVFSARIFDESESEQVVFHAIGNLTLDVTKWKLKKVTK